MNKFNFNGSYLQCSYCNGLFQNQNYDEEGNWQENPESLNELMWGIEGHWKRCTQKNPYADTRGFYGILIEVVESPVSVKPNWSKFNLDFIGNPSSKKVLEETRDKLAINVIISMAVSGTENYLALKQFWDAAIAGLIMNPSSKDVSSWNQIASRHDMPFRFGGDGRMDQIS